MPLNWPNRVARGSIYALALVLFLATSSTQTWGTAVTIEAGVSWALAQERARRISDIHYQLALDIPAKLEAPIKGELTIDFVLTDASSPLQLDFQQAPEHVVSVNGPAGRVDYHCAQEHLVIPAAALSAGHNRLQIEFVAGDNSLNRNPDYLYTLFVPDRARTAFPLFDQPDLKARYTLSLQVPKTWDAMANAPLLLKVNNGDSSTYRFATSELTSSYLFSFVTGEFQRETREMDGRTINLLHRETDSAKVERNLAEIFDLHAAALRWLEDYTGIPYPFAKFDFALIPSFQYGGMEHPGAIQYRADALLLDESPTNTQLLRRASLIAHETAHMWFGNLVTMQWFNDVWTKEVFANFMAGKIVEPSFPSVNHALNFLFAHYPDAYRVDRSQGANPIRQPLDNLNLAGQMYGPIIYDKAPIMMRQLERLIGEDVFRQGIQTYLRKYAFANATWPDLIDILDPLTESDLGHWSEVWVNSAGRPHFQVERLADHRPALIQRDPQGRARVWPQQFAVTRADGASLSVNSALKPVIIDPSPIQLNSNGLGYGLFPMKPQRLANFGEAPDLARGAALIDAWENFLAADFIAPMAYGEFLLEQLPQEQNQLILSELLTQLYRLHTNFLHPGERQEIQARLERILRQGFEGATNPGRARQFLDSYAALARTAEGLAHLRKIWSGEIALDTLPLSENNRIKLAEMLAIGLPTAADEIIATQRKQIENPDNLRRFDFVALSLSPAASLRDQFFADLGQVERRATENWVLDALAYLHHPTRTVHSAKYILPSLELLEEIQVTGDIFFPTAWVNASLRNHSSAVVIDTVDRFLTSRPDYNPQLRMKILQAADIPRRARAQLGPQREP